MNEGLKKNAGKCLSCLKPRCETGCPVHNSIMAFIKEVKQEDIKQAGRILYANNPFPELTSRLCDCDRQCQGHCVLGIKQTPVSIQSIERELSDQCERDTSVSKIYQGRIGMVGAGIGNLTCAYQLAKVGFDVEIYDQNDGIGGAILTGIPSYRFDHEYLSKIYQDLTKMNVKFHFNQRIDSNAYSKMKEEYDEVVLGIGAQKEVLPSFQDVQKGYLSGLELLHDLNIQKKTSYYQDNFKHAIVWGGGNVAMDCARSLKRILPKVSVCYRRSELEMPANQEEIQQAKQEGVEFIFLSNVNDLIVEDGILKGIDAIDMELKEKDASGRASCHEIVGSNHVIDCDLLVAAIGQKVDFQPIDENLTVLEDHKTSDDHVYICGDCHLGPKTVAACIYDGNMLAKQIMNLYQPM